MQSQNDKRQPNLQYSIKIPNTNDTSPFTFTVLFLFIFIFSSFILGEVGSSKLVLQSFANDRFQKLNIYLMGVAKQVSSCLSKSVMKNRYPQGEHSAGTDCFSSVLNSLFFCNVDRTGDSKKMPK